MGSNVTLTAGVRQNLLSLQATADMMATTQNRLATGKKVNSALDNPTNYFTSQSLNSRAGDLNQLLDSVGQAQQTLKAADNGISALTKLVQSAKSIATQAQQASKGTVNYTNITGSVAIAQDTTKTSSSALTVATAGTVSTQSTVTVNAAGISKLANGDTLSFTLNGNTVTATFGAATNTATNTFADAAGLISVLNSGTGPTGNFGAAATAASDGASGVKLTAANVTQDFTVARSVADVTFTNANQAAVNHTLGDALTVSDGSHTSTFYRVASGASAANGTYSDASTLASAVNSTANNIHSNITGAASGSGIDLTAGNNVGITVGGATGTALGFGAAESKNNFNSTLNALSGSVSVSVGSNTAQTLTFGSGNGQIDTLAGLNTALAGFTGITGSTDAGRHVNLAPASSDSVVVSGTPSVLSALGVGAGTTTPTATVVTPNATRASLQKDFNDLLSQVDQLAKDASYNGVNLLSGDDLKVTFNENGSSSLSIKGVKFDSAGLGLSSVSGTGFQDDKKINDTLATLDTALTSLRTQSSKFGTNLSTVQTRQDFTKSLVNTLQSGADSLVLADTNEEGANLLALQTRQQLSTTALSMANQASQAVLRLF